RTNPRETQNSLKIFSKSRFDVASYGHERNFVEVRDFYCLLDRQWMPFGESQDQGLAVESLGDESLLPEWKDHEAGIQFATQQSVGLLRRVCTYEKDFGGRVSC